MNQRKLSDFGFKKGNEDQRNEQKSDKRKVLKDSYDKNKRVDSWKVDYHWLVHESDADKMFCATCRENPHSDQSSSFVQGTASFRLENIKSHADSYQHQMCLTAARVAQDPQQQPLPRRHQFDNKFRTAYYIAKQEFPFSTYISLCELQTV